MQLLARRRDRETPLSAYYDRKYEPYVPYAEGYFALVVDPRLLYSRSPFHLFWVNVQRLVAIAATPLGSPVHTSQRFVPKWRLSISLTINILPVQC